MHSLYVMFLKRIISNQKNTHKKKKYKKHHSDRNKWKIVSEFVSWQVGVKIQYCTGK